MSHESIAQVVRAFLFAQEALLGAFERVEELATAKKERAAADEPLKRSVLDCELAKPRPAEQSFG